MLESSPAHCSTPGDAGKDLRREGLAESTSQAAYLGEWWLLLASGKRSRSVFILPVYSSEARKGWFSACQPLMSQLHWPMVSSVMQVKCGAVCLPAGPMHVWSFQTIILPAHCMLLQGSTVFSHLTHRWKERENSQIRDPAAVLVTRAIWGALHTASLCQILWGHLPKDLHSALC